jgi:hypothetical protein
MTLDLSAATALPNWPSWLLDPEHPDAPLDATEELHRLHIIRALAERVGRDPATLTPQEIRDIAEEIGADLALMAVIQGRALEHADKLTGLFEKSVILQAYQVSTTPYWAYHPERHGSWRDFLRAHITRSNRKYVAWLCDVAIPWMEVNGYQDAVRHVWNEDTIGKTKVMVDKLRAEFKQAGVKSEADAARPVSAELRGRLDAMLSDLADPDVDVAEFSERHRKPLPEARTETPPIPAFEFLSGDGAYVILVCATPDQLAHARLALKADWKLGTGKEPWLARLSS